MNYGTLPTGIRLLATVVYLLETANYQLGRIL